MKKLSLIVMGVVCLIVIASVFSVVYLKESKPYEKTTTPVRLADETNYTVESLGSLIDSLNDFSFNFYQKVSKDNSGNIFFSPYSIFVALSMTYEGAQGNTATQMQSVLNILQNDSATRGSFGKIYNLLNQKQDGYTISTANAFWAQQNYRFLPNYISILKSYYMAEANELDFSNNVKAAEIINAWIENNTNGKIKNMIDPGALSDLTRLVLTNAIYFKGLWENQFDSKDTSETDFKTTSNETVKVDMMHLSDIEFNYAETNDLQILKLPYKGNDLSMIIILPKESNVSIAESQLNAVNLTNWNSSLRKKEIAVNIPKFKFETEYNLNDILMKMGITDAFSGAADFSGMDGTRNLFISDVLHKAFVEVNEEGTEAAAASGVIMTLKTIPYTFNADHPFVFLIQHEKTGAILFMGKVTNPAE